MANTCVYSLCGANVSVSCCDSILSIKLGDLWRKCFAIEAPTQGKYSPLIQIQINDQRSCSDVSPIEQDLFNSDGFRLSKTSEGFRVQLGDSSLDIHGAHAPAICILGDDFWDFSFREQREFFLIGIVYLMREHGLFGLHANAIVMNSSGVLIAGRSGAGKTTLTLSMVRQGWGYVSDDATILQRTGQYVKALALRTGFACTEQTINAFPELVHASKLSNTGKVVLDSNSLYGESYAPECFPKVIIFPQITNRTHSEIVPVNATNALVSLIKQSPGVSAGGEASREHLDVLNMLVNQARSYRFQAGTDVYQNPSTVSDMLYGALTTP